MDNLMEAFTKIDHGVHVQYFTERMKAIVTTDHLRKVCEKYRSEKGLFSEREVVAVFKWPNSTTIVEKRSFTKAKGEFVAEMVLVYRKGKSCTSASISLLFLHFGHSARFLDYL